MLTSVHNDTSYPASLPNWLAGRSATNYRSKAKHNHGSILTQQDALVALTSFQFDATRNVLTRTDARGDVTAYTCTMVAGESYGVSVSMKNIGSTTWMPTTLHNLGSQDPEDNEMWGMGRVVMPIASAAPGVTVEFVWTVTAPLTPGSYAFQWEMVQDGVEHFGDFSPLVTVTVAASELGVPDGLLNAVWDSDNLLLELDGALSTTGRYTDSPGMWGGLVSEWQSAQLVDSWDAAGSSFYGYDSQSSTRLLTNASGVVTDNYAYRAFGTDWQSGNGSRNSYRYVGQYGYYRDSAAMQYVRARYLDVQAGRWVSRDPIGYDGGDWNLYRYVGNGVVGRMDPSGRYECKCGCKGTNCHCPVQCHTRCPKDGTHPGRGKGIQPTTGGYPCSASNECEDNYLTCVAKKKAKKCKAGEVPMYITCYNNTNGGTENGNPLGPGTCASRCDRYNSGSTCGCGTDINIPVAGGCRVCDCGKGPHTKNGTPAPKIPNNWLDVWYKPCKLNTPSCWVCMPLPPGCQPNGGTRYKPL